ncbi:MAG: c-type cytochrome [Ferruginibacter sp.]
MKKLFLVFMIISSGLVCLLISCNEQKTSGTEQVTADSAKTFTAEQAARGAYLVQIMGCSDCHTPLKMGANGPEPDMEHYLSGYPSGLTMPPLDTAAAKKWILMSYTSSAFTGPWGTSFAANLTSDETGIGNWNLGQFKKAMKEGKWKGMDGNRTLLPPMPWQNFKNIKDADIRDIFAYLKSTKPINNAEPAWQPPVGM